jgi:hypothetical protein
LTSATVSGLFGDRRFGGAAQPLTHRPMRSFEGFKRPLRGVVNTPFGGVMSRLLFHR